MSARAEALAERLEAINDEVIATVEGCSDAQWRKACQGEGWSVAVTAHHIAASHEPVAGFVLAVANGQPVPPLTGEMLDQGNAEHARQYANCSKAETLDLLRRGGKAAVDAVRGLSDQQLDRSAALPLLGGATLSAQQLVEMVSIGHPTEHLESIRTAL